MPDITRPDGATIHYEVFGSGYPLLLIAPGGVSSQIEFWRRSAVNPIERFAGDYQVELKTGKALGHAYGGGSQFFSMWVVGRDKPE